MDEVTSKLKKLFKSKPKAFKGQGQKLGSSGQTAPSATSAPARPSQNFQRATPQQQPAREKPTPVVNDRPLGLQSAQEKQRSIVPPASVVTTGAYIVPEEEKPTEAQQEAFALLSSAPQRTAAAEVLSRVLRNIVERPTEFKYRKLRLNNKKVQQAVVDVNGGLELLQASGFELVFDESSPEPQPSAAPMPTTSIPPQGSPDQGLACSESQSRADLPVRDTSLKGTSSAESAGQGTPTAAGDAAQTESGLQAAAAIPAESALTGYLWFPEETELWLLQAALQLLRPLTPLPFSKTSSKSAGQASPHRPAQSAVTTRGSNTPSSSSSMASLSAKQTAAPAATQPAAVPAHLTQNPLATASPGSISYSRSDTNSAQPMAASGSSGVTNLSHPRPRRTQVLLPEQTDAQVPDWVFQQSPVDLKQAYTAAKKRRAMDSMLMTRAYREKLAGGKTQKGTYIYAVIRVRLPEGLLLQGEFNAQESVTAIFEWVSDSLRDPSLTYDLILPTREPLVTSMGRMSDADLLPSVLLNLRFTAPAVNQQQMPSLCQSMLQQIE